MTKDELAVMDGGKCILQVRGVRPFYSKKYDITKHMRYKELSDYDNKNIFDIERYVRPHRRIKKNDMVETFEVDLSKEE